MAQPPSTEPATSAHSRSAEAARHVAVVVPAAAVVVLALTGPIHRDLWLDEAFSMAAARRPWVSIEGEHGTMAAYYLLAALWVQVSEAPWWFRFLSTLTMAGAVLAFTSLAVRQYGRQIGIRAGVFASGSLLVVIHAGDARSYALVCLLVIATWLALDHGLERPDQRRWWVLHSVACALIPFAHGMAILQLAVQGLVLVAARPGWQALRRACVGYTLALGVLGGLALTGLGNEGSGVWIEPPTWSEVPWLLQQLTSPEPPFAWLLGLTAVVGAYLTLRAASAVDPPRVRDHPSPGTPPPTAAPLVRLRRLQPAAWGIGAVLLLLAVCLIRPSHLARYTIASVFGIALLMAFTSREVDRRAGRIPAASIGIFVVLLVGVSIYAESPTDGWSQATRIVATEAADGDAIVFPTDDPRLPFEANWNVLGVDRGPELIGSEDRLGSLHRFPTIVGAVDLAETTPDVERLWVVSQPHRHVPDLTADYLDAVGGRFVEVQRWDLPTSITVRLLEHTDSPGS